MLLGRVGFDHVSTPISKRCKALPVPMPAQTRLGRLALQALTAFDVAKVFPLLVLWVSKTFLFSLRLRRLKVPLPKLTSQLPYPRCPHLDLVPPTLSLRALA